MSYGIAELIRDFIMALSDDPEKTIAGK